MSPEIDFNRLQMSAALRDPQDMKSSLRRWLVEGMHTAYEDYPGIKVPPYAQVYRALPQNPTARESAIDTVGQALAAVIIEEIHPRTKDSTPDYLLVTVLSLAAMLECPKHLEEPLKLIPEDAVPEFEDFDRSGGVDYRSYLELAIEANTLLT